MSQLAALNVKITGDSADLQSDLASAKTQVASFSKQTSTAQVGTQKFSGSLSALGNVSGNTRAKIQNTSFQLQDIAVQLQGGTRASTVFAQQLPQLLGAFGAVGAIAGVLAGVGIPALAFAFSALGKEAETLDEALERIDESFGALETPLNILSLSADDLAKKYGAAADQVLRFALAQSELAIASAKANLSDQVRILGDVTDKYISGTKAGRDYRNSLNRITRDFGLGRDAAIEFEGLLEDINNAEAFEDQQEGLAKVLEFLEAKDIDLSAIPEALRQAISEMITLSNETDRANALIARMEEGNFGGDDDEDDDDPANRGRKKVNPLVGDLEQLEEELMTQEELLLASYERQQQTLRDALDQQLLTREEYNSLMEDAQAQHSQRMAQLAVYKYGSTLQQTGQFLGDMAAAMQGGNDRMLRIARAFSAAEALINSYRAYAQVIADPTLPWFAKVPAALGVLSAGLGMVSAIKGVSGGSSAGAAPAASRGFSSAPAMSSAPSFGGSSSAGSGGGGGEASAQRANVQLTLIGDQGFSRSQIVQIAEALNDSGQDGQKLIDIRGRR